MKYKCPSCSRERETDKHLAMIICPACMVEMEKKEARRGVIKQ